jgi:hypothetical protein
MITDSQQVQVEVLQRVIDSQMLQASVYTHRVTDSQQLQMTVSPRLRDSIELRVTVINQALAAGAAEKVLAPEADINFV